jgi:hypothetical protein
MILVACPLAAAANASRLLSLMTASSAPASLMELDTVGSSLLDLDDGFCLTFCFTDLFFLLTFSSKDDSLLICFGFQDFGFLVTFGLQDSIDCFSPSAVRMTALFSRSAFICFSIASRMAAGG